MRITSKGRNLLIGTAIVGLLTAGAVASTGELNAASTPTATPTATSTPTVTPDWTVASCTLWDNPTHTATLPAYTDTDRCINETTNTVVPTKSSWSTVEDFGD